VLRLFSTSLSTVLDPYRTLFQLTLAAGLIAILRNEVGLKTYGLFAPIVLALTLLSTGFVWGLGLFLNIFIISLGVYTILEPLNIGTAHRLGVIISVVAISVAAFLVMGDIGLLPRLSGTTEIFFPAIVTAWYADRFASAVEERGWSVPSIQFIWTLLAIVLTYALISTRPIVDWYIRTPELWVLLIATNLYLGFTTRTRLKEYYRFSSHWGGFVNGIGTRIQVVLSNVSAWIRQEPRQTSLTDVLSINIRNRYIKQYNPGHLRTSAGKVETKRRLHGLGIPTPDTYAIIETKDDLSRAQTVFEKRDSFVIKPDDAYGDEGILIVTGRTEEMYQTTDGEKTVDDLVRHVRRIIQGQYAGIELSGAAIIEQRVVASRSLARLSSGGVPDIRIIVFQGYPIMGMTRLPTIESRNQANLHKGAIGVGLAVADGTPLGAYQQSHHRWVLTHPDTGVDLTAFRVPEWDTILQAAVETAAASGLGYAGVDLTLDESTTPLVFEVNAYPGLGIQNTTRLGLLKRLEWIDGLPPECEFYPPEKKVELAQQWDAAEYQ
jgi:alpha-L-glutamate ligase-like protein